jgi:hypothetical protein
VTGTGILLSVVIPEQSMSALSDFAPGDYQRKLSIDGKVVTVDGMYLRIIAHANEHMVQSIADQIGLYRRSS